MNLALVIIGCFAAAVIGDQIGFTLGRRLGPSLLRRPDSRFYKREYVDRTEAFFARHGPKTVLVARFVPVVRTFTPVLAGVGKMSRRTFLSYNVVGAFIWVVGVTMAGFLLGSVIGTSIDRYLLPVVLLVVLISLVPAFLEWRMTRKQPPTP
jgi:membrane-associated protein